MAKASAAEGNGQTSFLGVSASSAGVSDSAPFQKARLGNQLRIILAGAPVTWFAAEAYCPGTPRSGKSTLMRQFDLMATHDFAPPKRLYARVVIHNNILLCLKDIIILADTHGSATPPVGTSP